MPFSKIKFDMIASIREQFIPVRSLTTVVFCLCFRHQTPFVPTSPEIVNIIILIHKIGVDSDLLYLNAKRAEWVEVSSSILPRPRTSDIATGSWLTMPIYTRLGSSDVVPTNADSSYKLP